MQHNCIKLKCYITLEKDKDAKKKRNDQQQQQHQMTPPSTPTSLSNMSLSHTQESMLDSMLSPTSPFGNKSASGANSMQSTPTNTNGGGAKKVNVEVIMKSNPFRVGKLNGFMI